ncbi:MAG TPA: hypothetical protein VMV77_08910 [Bacteroidales bacterium]|nr:hypothetical protein [Bacteroidales bacterium]
MGAPNTAMFDIQRVIAVDFVNQTPAMNFNDDGDFVDEAGFFIRAETTGYLKYCPINNKSDGEAIEKTFTASNIFIDPEVCRKIFHELEAGGQRSMAEVIYVGYGV